MKSAPQAGYGHGINEPAQGVIMHVGKNKAAGFTIAELLLALAITALLLAAVAAAFNASVINYRENERIFRTINSARQALSRITSQLRTARAVDPDSPVNECALITAEGDDIRYQYDDDDHKLYLVKSDNSKYVLCDNIIAMSFTKNTATEDAVTYVKSVQISLTIADGDLQKSVSAAVVIRKNLKS